ncbi:reverse transcriptase domain-containing protein [Tanacetum coccineum]
MLKYRVTQRLSTMYQPQTNGQVEVSNCGLKRILERTVGENRASWSDKLDDTVWAFCTTFKTPIGCTPYKLMYGKACHLPIELEHKAYWALKHCNFDLKSTGDHRKVQMNQLNELLDQSYENSLIYKEKTNKIHDSKIKNRVFNVDVETGAETDKTNSEGDTEILNIVEEQGEDVANQVNLEEKTTEVDKGQAGSDPRKTPESRPPPKRILMEENHVGLNPGQSHVSLARPNPKPMHEDFVATVYPQVHESLKHTDEEHVHLENPLSSTGTLSSMKNLKIFNFDDKFFNDKRTEKEPDKANMETEVESMVTVLTHQASSSVPPLSTLVIDLTPPKHVSPTIQALILTATTATTTTTLPLLPPLQQQSSLDPDLASRVSALEQVCANFEKKHKLQDKTVQGLSSRVFEEY